MASKKVKQAPSSKSMWILIWVQTLATITIIASLVMCVVTQDTTILSVLIPSVLVDASAVTALVLWKRKNENVMMFIRDKTIQMAIKWLMEQGIDPADFIRAFKE